MPESASRAARDPSQGAAAAFEWRDSHPGDDRRSAASARHLSKLCPRLNVWKINANGFSDDHQTRLETVLRVS